jgi:hypothetical protein
MTSCCELLAGFGDAGLDGGDELKGIVLVPTRETAMLALEFCIWIRKALPYPGCGYICLNST